MKLCALLMTGVNTSSMIINWGGLFTPIDPLKDQKLSDKVNKLEIHISETRI